MKRRFIKGFLVASVMFTILGKTTSAQELVNYEPVDVELTAGVSSTFAKCLDGSEVSSTAGVSSALIDCMNTIEVVGNDYNIVAEPYIDVELIESGTKLYSTANLNIRSGASSDASYIGTLANGSSFVLDEDLGNGWLKFTYKDSDAYVSAEYVSTDAPFIKVSSTAYWDEYNRCSASGRELKSQYSVAGMVSWLGRTINVYECNENGSIGKLRGTYRFDDTGYGAESGCGESKILEGRSVGTIENGTCIDFYFNTESECINYGRQPVYIQFVD